MKIIPSGAQLAQQVIIAMVAAVALAWVMGHAPTFKAWMNKEQG